MAPAVEGGGAVFADRAAADVGGQPHQLPLGKSALAPVNRVAQRGAGDVAEAVGDFVAGGAPPEEPIMAKPELHTIERVGAHPGDATPGHLAGVDRP
jgi:hypothetical protein